MNGGIVIGGDLLVVMPLVTAWAGAQLGYMAGFPAC